MNRRQFLATSTAAVIAAALKDVPLFGRQGQLTTSFEDLRRGVGIFNGQGGTIGWLVNGDGIVVIDSQNAAAAQACIDGIKQRSTRPIDLLINTHHHGDHTAGNQTFRPVVGSIVLGSQMGPNPEKSPARNAASGTEKVLVSDRRVRCLS